MGISYVPEKGLGSINSPFEFWCTLLTISPKNNYTQQIAMPWAIYEEHLIAYRVKDNQYNWCDWQFMKAK